MVQEFIVLKMKYKGTEIIFRRWFEDGKEEIQVDDNFARLMGFPSKEELIKEMRNEVKALSKSLAPYKRPINVIVTDKELPRTATRKIKRRDVSTLDL